MILSTKDTKDAKGHKQCLHRHGRGWQEKESTKGTKRHKKGTKRYGVSVYVSFVPLVPCVSEEEDERAGGDEESAEEELE